MKVDDPLIKTSFSFYQADVDALTNQVNDLRAAGLKVRRATVLRALLTYATDIQLFSHAALLAEAQRARGGPREAELIADYPTPDLPENQVKRLDDTVTDLLKKDIPANRSFVMRALLRGLPAGTDMVAVMKRFQKEFPAKPRGWAARKLKEGKGG